MQWSTQVPISSSSFPASHRHPIVLAGSCFSENIGALLRRHKFPTCINPFGILYNPLSIGRSLEAVIQNRRYNVQDLVPHGGLWHSMDHHGSFSAPDKDTVLRNINNAITQAREMLEKASHLFLTWGSAFAFRYHPTGQIAGNCHKLPGSHFSKELLTPENIVADYTRLIHSLLSSNPKLCITLSISPVRHWREGAENNQVSKATLLLAKHTLCREFPNLHYFPAYEIVMDELRDYRFYADDLLHPGHNAIQYIYERFGDTWFSKETRTLLPELDKILQAAGHRPLHGITPEYREFCQKMATMSRQLSGRLGIKLDEEIEHFTANLQDGP